MIIRQVTFDDKNNVLKILDQFREECIFQITNTRQKSTSAVDGGVNIYDDLINNNNVAIFIVEEDNKIKGIISGYLVPMLRNGKNRLEIEDFFVVPEMQGKGVATKLMEAMFAWAKEKGAVKVNLESDLGLKRAHCFYEKYGFTTDARRFVKKII